jgi:hypothetical protein
VAVRRVTLDRLGQQTYKRLPLFVHRVLACCNARSVGVAAFAIMQWGSGVELASQICHVQECLYSAKWCCRRVPTQSAGMPSCLVLACCRAAWQMQCKCRVDQ